MTSLAARQRGTAMLFALLVLILLTILVVGSLKTQAWQDRSSADERNMQASQAGAISALDEAFRQVKNADEIDIRPMENPQDGTAPPCKTEAQHSGRMILCNLLEMDSYILVDSHLANSRPYSGPPDNPVTLGLLAEPPRWYASAYCESRSSSSMTDCSKGVGTFLILVRARGVGTSLPYDSRTYMEEYARVVR